MPCSATGFLTSEAPHRAHDVFIVAIGKSGPLKSDGNFRKVSPAYLASTPSQDEFWTKTRANIKYNHPVVDRI